MNKEKDETKSYNAILLFVNFIVSFFFSFHSSFTGEPCELYCTDTEESVIVPWGEAALDGTPCNVGTRDMCIAGICRVNYDRFRCIIHIHSFDIIGELLFFLSYTFWACFPGIKFFAKDNLIRRISGWGGRIYNEIYATMWLRFKYCKNWGRIFHSCHNIGIQL